jgi:hypothetical protein
MTFFRRRGVRRPNLSSINVEANSWVVAEVEEVEVEEEVLMKEALRGSLCLPVKAITFSEKTKQRERTKKRIRINEYITSNSIYHLIQQP